MKKAIKENKGKITLGGIGVGISILIALLTLIEKTEAFIARVASRNPAYEMTKYSQERPFLRGQEPSNIQASKK